jgi:carnitine O-acetyltransferase
MQSYRILATRLYRIKHNIKMIATTTTTTQTQIQMQTQMQERDNKSLFPQKRFIQSPHRYLSTAIASPSKTTSKSPFKKWPISMIESQGDYQQDAAILEPIISGPLYSAQSKLPTLPIPNLKDTIDTFLPTALPLIESQHEGRQFIEACKAFPQQAQALHQKLIHRKEGGLWNDSSWLQLWWNTDGYLKIRDPVTVNVSYFFHFADDPTIVAHRDPESEAPSGSDFESPSESPPTPTPTPITTQAHMGIKRGAAMLHASAEFRKLICSGSFHHQRIGRKEPKTPLCSAAFKYMFNACRIPRREMDSYRIYDPSLHSHCIVARKGRYFAVDFVDLNGDPVSLDLLEERLQQCIDLADGNGNGNSSDGEIPMLGWLTSSDRDSWADAREEILRVGGTDAKQALEKLESGALMLCLDDDEPFSKKQCADVFWTGNHSSGHNRWFDKSIQLFCTKNGKAGLQGEHSMVSVLCLYCDCIFVFIVMCRYV